MNHSIYSNLKREVKADINRSNWFDNLWNINVTATPARQLEQQRYVNVTLACEIATASFKAKCSH